MNNNRNTDFTKVEWTEAQLIWLKKHYINTKNDKITEELCKIGQKVSIRSVQRKARKMGLKKSKQFMRKCSMDAIEKAIALNESTGYAFSIKGASDQWRRYRETGQVPKSCFKKGQNLAERFGKEKEAARLAKSKATRNETIRRERRRIELGLEQMTNIQLITHYTRRELYLRSKARKKGYIVFRNEETIYYNKETDRSSKFEQTLQKNEIVIAPLCMQGKKLVEYRTMIVSAGDMMQ